MDTKPAAEETRVESDSKIVLRLVIFVLLMPGILFLAAGTLNWWEGWVFAGVFVAVTMTSRLLMFRTHPDLLQERARSMEAEDAKAWDRVLVPIVAMYGPLVTWAVAGLDKRFTLSPQLALTWELGGLAGILLGYLLATWAMFENRFFSGVVRIQTDRDHTVVTTGPYRLMRHPSYSGAIVSGLATPVLLSTLWALIPAGLTAVGFIVRTALEDRTLIEELPGYADYAQRTRYRLLPGIW